VVLAGYNAALGVWPMVAMNVAIAGLDVHHLVRLLRSRDDAAAYEVVEVGPDEEHLSHVLRQHAPDIERHNPGFGWGAAADGGAGRVAFLVLRDTETVGVVLLSEDGSRNRTCTSCNPGSLRVARWCPRRRDRRRPMTKREVCNQRTFTAEHRSPSAPVHGSCCDMPTRGVPPGWRCVQRTGQVLRSSSTAKAPPSSPPTRPSSNAV